MSVVRRGAVTGVALGLVLLGGTAYAQEDPCAPDADGNVPLMCQSGAPSDTGTVGTDPDASALPVTGPTAQLLALGVLGSGLVVAGAGAVAAGRRRTVPQT